MNFPPVRTMDDLNSLDGCEIIEGYVTTQPGDPEPGPNRGRAFWHGWRNKQMDFGLLEPDDASRQLAAEFLKDQRRKRDVDA